MGLSRYLAKKSLFPSDCHFQSSWSTSEVVALKTVATFIFRFIQYILNILQSIHSTYILIYSIIPTSVLCGGAGYLEARPADRLQGLEAAGGEGGEQQEGDHGDQQEPHFPDLSTTWSVDQDWMQPGRRSSSFKDPLHHLSSHASSSLTAADPLMSKLSAIFAFFA